MSGSPVEACVLMESDIVWHLSHEAAAYGVVRLLERKFKVYLLVFFVTDDAFCFQARMADPAVEIVEGSKQKDTPKPEMPKLLRSMSSSMNKSLNKTRDNLKKAFTPRGGRGMSRTPSDAATAEPKAVEHQVTIASMAVVQGACGTIAELKTHRGGVSMAHACMHAQGADKPATNGPAPAPTSVKATVKASSSEGGPVEIKLEPVPDAAAPKHLPPDPMAPATPPSAPAALVQTLAAANPEPSAPPMPHEQVRGRPCTVLLYLCNGCCRGLMPGTTATCKPPAHLPATGLVGSPPAQHVCRRTPRQRWQQQSPALPVTARRRRRPLQPRTRVSLRSLRWLAASLLRCA